MTGVGRLSGVALECRDPAALAEFYHRILGWPLTFTSDDWYSLESPGGDFHLSFQLSPGYQPPHWPDPASSMQFHLHVKVDDHEEAVRLILALGGTHLDAKVFADPAGHPFCLVP